MTNNSIFTRVLALMICFIMLVGSLTACFQETDHNHNVGTTTNGEVTTKPTTTTTTTGDVIEDEPTEDPVDPNVIFSASTNISSDSLIYGTLANDVVIGGTEVGALVPADVKVEAGASSLALSVKKVDEELLGDALSALDVHINGVALDNTVPMIVKLGAILEAGLGATELKLYHTENGVDNLMTRVNSPADFAIHNQYYYNAETGEVTIYIASFSVISAVKSVADVWDGSSDTSWYNENDTEFTLTTAEQFAGFRDLVDDGNTFEGKTVKLGVDIDLKNIAFDPIGFGYYDNDDSDGKTNYRVFLGTFDGGNHTIYNLYENCWELDPDKTNYGTYTYSTAGAGLFASVKDATIKNIAINGAKVVFECVDMGVLVGYAQGECHFENIVISNAKIANYNRYTGGLVGEVSYGVDNNGDGYSHTFKNITIDSTVTVSGLWGSFGCGMGGVIGGKWGTAIVLMENVVSAPVMDVYNDVVSAYQWYAFRGCGMLIGHTEEPYSDGRTSGVAKASFLTCENVKVYYGDWVNYTYYQFANQDSGTGRSYPWVRAEAGEYCEAFSNIRYGVPTHNGVKVSDLTEEELKAVATDYTPIVFNQLYGADRGMYGQAEHDGVTVINKNTKTIYIENNLGWENLKLHYWYKHGDDTWTNHDTDGIDMSKMLVEGNIYKVDIPAYAYAFVITADGDNSTEEFVLAELKEKDTYTVSGEEHEHDFSNGGKCACGCVKLTVNIIDYATTNNWQDTTQYKEITLGYSVMANAIGAGNTGKYYTNGNDWRLYQSENATLKISTPYGTIVSVKVTYTSNNAGVLKLNGNNITTGTEVNVNANDITFVVGNTGTATNGQARITAIEVVYMVEIHNCEENVTGATCTENAVCGICGIEIPDTKLNHDYTNNPYKCSLCGELQLPAAGKTVTLAEAELIAQAMGGERTKDVYKITGTITTELSGTDGATTLTDGTKNIYVVSINNYSDTGKGSVIYKDFANKDSFAKGNEIILYGNIGLQGDTVKLYGAYLTGHIDVTTDTDHNCDVCGAENVTEHNYVGGTCDCGVTEPTDPTPDPEPETPTTTTVSKSHTDIADIAGVNTSGGNINGTTIKLDDYISIVCAKGTSTSNPAIYGESIRLYQGGATLTVKGNGMKTIIITLANNADGDGPISVTGGKVDNASAPTNYVYTITVDEGVSEVVITTKGTDKNSRLYVANIEVEYVSTGSGSGSEGGDTGHTHSYTGNVTTAATCTIDGVMTYTCTCGEGTYTEVIKATGHNYVDGSCTVCSEKDPSVGTPTWEKATSLSVGDTIVIVCEGKKMELTSVASYGTGTSYSGIPQATYTLTVVEGSTSGTYAFKDSNGKYLSWSSGNSLTLSGTLNANSSWNVSFSNGNAVITNAKDSSRKLQWNASSPRFAAYTSAQTAIAIYVLK